MGRGTRVCGTLAATLAATAIGIPGALATLPTECPEGSTRWANPVSGNWEDASKWSAGLPGGGKPACIDQPGSYVVTASLDVFAQSVFHGSPGAATQPTLKVVRHDIEAADDIVSYGRLELALSPAPGTTARFLAGGRIAIAPGGTLATTGSGGVLEAPTIEHAGASALAVGLTTRGDFVNTGDVTVPANHTLRMEPRGTIAQTITFAGGSVNAVGNVHVIGNHIGVVNVTGGTLSGDVDLFQLATLTFAGGSGGEYDLQTTSINQGSVSTVNGVIAPTQRLNLGGANTTGFTDGLVNHGTLRVFSTGGLGNSGVFLRARPGATYINRGTTLLDGGGVLSGAIVNEADGTLAVTSGNLRSPVFSNRGTIDVASGGNLDIRADTNGAAPSVVFEDGQTNALGGWSQLGGTLDVRGGTLSGDVDLFQLATLTFAGGSGGAYDLQTPSINTQTVSTVNGVIGPTQRLNLGGANTTGFTDGLVNEGTLRVFSTGGLGNNGVFLRARPGATYTNRGTTMLDGGGVLSGAIVNEADGTLAVTSGNLRSPVFTNRGTTNVASGGNLDIRAETNGAAPTVIFEAGQVNAVGGWSQLGGTLRVTGGTLAGDLDLNTIGLLDFSGGGGGVYDMFTGGTLNGTIGSSQTVNVGSFSTHVFTDGLVNNGTLRVFSTGGLGNNGVFLRTRAGATLTNNATLNVDGGGALAGTLVNEPGGTIATAGANLRSPVLTNRGTLSVTSGTLDVRADTGGAHPVVVLEGGTLSLGGTYNQLNGSFKTLDGTVSSTGTVNFTTVAFSGVGTWARNLVLAVGGSMAPGASPGLISITGNYTPSTATVTQIELGAPEHDRIAISGTAQLAGTLQVVVPADFQPTPCQTFEVMTWGTRTGTFVNPGPIDLGGGISVRQVYTANSLLLVTYAPALAVNVHPSEVEVSEDGLTDTYDVCVPAAPAGTRTVTIAPDTQVTTDRSSLAFTAANWQLPQTVTVSAVDDDLAEPTPHVGLVAHTASGGVPVSTVTAQIADDGDVPVDEAPPVVTATPSPGPNPAGWNNSDVDVTISADDGPDGTGVAAIHYVLNGVPVTVHADSVTFTLADEGVHEVSYWATDGTGNDAEPQSLTVRIDKTAPTLAFGATAPAPNAAGWNNTVPVTVPFTADDALSGVDTVSAASPLSFDAETAGATRDVTVTDAAGNSATFTSQTVRIDTTAPSVAFGATSPAPNAAGWNNTVPVTIPFTADDALSGLDTVSETSPLAFDAETAGATRDVTATDVAGNSATYTSQTVRIDTTAPAIAIRSPEARTYAFDAEVPADFDCSDGLSGLDACAGTVADGELVDTSTAGDHSFTVSARDVAGNAAEASVVYVVGSAVALCLVQEPRDARAGSVVPFKVQLCTPGGANLSSPAIVLTAVGVDAGPATSPGNSHPGELFKFDSQLGGSGGYQYNLKTAGLASGSHVLKVAVSGQAGILEIPFTLR